MLDLSLEIRVVKVGKTGEPEQALANIIFAFAVEPRPTVAARQQSA
jgi:hypothetical protein